MRIFLLNFLEDRQGATAVEYAMIAVLVSIVIVAGTSVIGSNLSTLYFGKLLAGF